MAHEVAVRVNGAPNETATAATAVQVTEMVGQPTCFSLEYSFDTTDGDFPLLTGGVRPESELSVIVSSADKMNAWQRARVRTTDSLFPRRFRIFTERAGRGFANQARSREQGRCLGRSH